jgi:hypothetical protein
VAESVVHLLAEAEKVENVNLLTVKVEMVAENVVHLTNQQEKDLSAETVKVQNVESVSLNNFS